MSLKKQINFVILLSGVGLVFVFTLLYISINNFEVKQEVSKARLLTDTVIDFRNYIASVASKISVLDENISPFACTPAYVVNQVAKKLKRQKNFLLRQVSDEYRNIYDRPTAAEMKAIDFFKTHKNAKEYWQIHDPHNGGGVYEQKHIFYAKPLFITKSCLKCHGDPKKDVPPRLYKLLVKEYGNRAFYYKIGDLRGIISVIIPYNNVIETLNKIFMKIVIIILLFYAFGTVIFVKLTSSIENAIDEILEHFNKNLRQGNYAHIIRSFKLKEFDKLKEEINKTFEKINEYQEKLYNKLYFNEISQLPSRNKFFEEFEDGKNPVVILDMDKFKDINILFGVKTGDKLIKEIANRLKELSKRYDFKLYHLDVDKFALVFPSSVDKDKISEIMKDILNYLEEYYNIEDNQIVVKFRAGVSATKKEYIMAELAQEKAKEFRKDIVYCSEIPNLKNAYEENLKIFRELKDAIENDRIVPFYQPIVDSKKQIRKYEALVRMIDKEGNIISPFKFLNIAKKTRSYAEITKRVVQKAFEKFNNKDKGVSINLDLYDLESDEMRSFILSMLKTYNVNAIFEIVESEEVEESPELMGFLRKLQENGAKIYIDDFGSGYANFDYLLKLNPNGVKIDGSLIKNILTNKNNEIIVKSIVDFAHNVNMEVVAEFVENEEIFDKLQQMGVDFYQGYYFSPPKPDIEE